MFKKFLGTFILFSVIIYACSNQEPKSTQDGPSQIINMSPQDFQTQQTSGGVLIDVRTPGEFEAGHLSNAKNINIMSSESEFLNHVNKLILEGGNNKSTPVFVYCKLGGRSTKAAKLLKSEGYNVIYNLDGGIESWIESGLEVVQ